MKTIPLPEGYTFSAGVIRDPDGKVISFDELKELFK